MINASMPFIKQPTCLSDFKGNWYLSKDLKMLFFSINIHQVDSDIFQSETQRGRNKYFIFVIL